MSGVLLSECWRRRVPHILGAYLVTVTAMIQFVDWLGRRYMFSPHWTDLVIAAAASIIPSVAVVSFYRANVNLTKGGKRVKFVVLANVLLAVVFIILTFGAKDLGAMTTLVSVENEQGFSTQRAVPKSEFRKRIALFYFDGLDTEETGWLRYAIANAIMLDLFQDGFVDLRYPVHFRERLRKAGFQNLVGVPLALQREIAEREQREWFLGGNVSATTTGFRIQTRLYQARSGKLVEDRTYEGSNWLELVDRVGTDLRKDLKVPEREDILDLPVVQLLTANQQALRAYADAERSVLVNDDYASGLRLYGEAVALDPGFAFAQYQLGIILHACNRPQEAAAALQAALDNLFRIPERLQWAVKATYYTVNQNRDKANAAVEAWAELFPDDLDALRSLAGSQYVRGQLRAAMATFERIATIDPQDGESLRALGQLCEQAGEIERARGYYEQYVARFPDDERGHTSLGDLCRILGKHDEAKRHYDKALLLDPGNISSVINRAMADLDSGSLAEARSQLEGAQREAKTPAEKAEVLSALRTFYAFQGQMGTAIRYMEEYHKLSEQSLPPLSAMILRLGDLQVYCDAGRTEEAWRVLTDLKARIAPPYDALLPIGAVGLHVKAGDASAATEALAAMEAVVEQMQLGSLRYYVWEAKGQIAELGADWNTALRAYEEQLRLDPTAASIQIDLGRCHRSLGDLKRAEQATHEALRQKPADPKANYELALILLAQGQLPQARECLEKALIIWSEADPAYLPAQQARSKLAELSGAATGA